MILLVWLTYVMVDFLDSGDEESEVKEITMGKSDVKRDCKSGAHATAVQYPLMNACGIPLENNQTIDEQPSELVKIKNLRKATYK